MSNPSYPPTSTSIHVRYRSAPHWTRAALVTLGIGAAAPQLGCATSNPWLDPDPTDAAYPPPCHADGVDACRLACQQDDAAACLAMAEAYDSGHGKLPRDPVKSINLEMHSCVTGFARACWYAGLRLLPRPGDPVNEQALALVEQSCQLGFDRGCVTAGVFRGRADVRGGDLSASAAFFRRGCSNGDGTSCDALADLARLDLASADDGRWQDLRQRACTLGEKAACNNPQASFAMANIAEIASPSPPVDELAAALGRTPPARLRVEIEYCVDTAGHVSSTSLKHSSNFTAVDELALDTVKRWRFVPVPHDSETVLGCTSANFVFNFGAGDGD